MAPSLLPLLADPRETLLVLEYVSTHPTATDAVRDLSISRNTWYLAGLSSPFFEDPANRSFPPVCAAALGLDGPSSSSCV